MNEQTLVSCKNYNQIDGSVSNKLRIEYDPASLHYAGTGPASSGN